MGSSFPLFLPAKYLNFGGVRSKIQKFASFDSGNIHIRKSEKLGFNFSMELRTKFV